MEWFNRDTNYLSDSEQGQAVVEYALIVAVVSVALIALMATFGQSLVNAAVSKVAKYAV